MVAVGGPRFLARHQASGRKRSYGFETRMTDKQGQYLAFIQLLHQAPSASAGEADLQRYFQVTPPTVQQMVLSLEAAT